VSHEAEEDETGARIAVIETARAMIRRGLSRGRSGNVSRRWRGGMLITPSGMAYDALAPEDVVFVAEDGSVPAGQCRPSSEWRFHRAAYGARADMHAVVHAHSLHAAVLSCAHKPIPAFHYMVAVAGGADIPCVPYATFGTEALAQHVAGGLASRNACLMANHGQVALGVDLVSALELAAEVEALAEQYCKLLAVGEPRVLSDREMADVLERFRVYGQRAQNGIDEG
jgi:L-fuculose-phosphate aldolase